MPTGKQNGSVSALENNTGTLPYSQESRHASSLALQGAGTPRAVSQEDVSRWVSLFFQHFFFTKHHAHEYPARGISLVTFLMIF